MKRKKKNPRGLFERPPGSGVWWVNYYVDGKQHREKAGSISNAKKLYGKRKEDARAGRKLPELRSSRFVSLAELIDIALEYVAKQKHKDQRNYDSKAVIVKQALGARPASEITPQELGQWLHSHCKTSATSNRYKAFISLCYREGIANGKVTSNPARLLRGKREGEGRLRFLSYDEYDRLLAATHKLFPEHVSELIVSVKAGLRLSEQYTTTWGQVHYDRRVIGLTKTKNNSARDVALNADVIEALKSIDRRGKKASDRVFPREGDKERFDTRSWFVPCMKEAGIDGYVWHCNRHTFCSWLAMAGATIKEIQEAAGHKTITMSARYAHLTPEHKQSVVEKISTIKA